MTDKSGDPLEIQLQNRGGTDVWLMPLSLIGCVVVLGPVLAVIFQNMPDHWIHEYQVAITVVLTLASAVVLLTAFFTARFFVARGHRRLRIQGQTVSIGNGKGTKIYAERPREEVVFEPRNWIIDAQSGRYITPVLWIEFPGLKQLTVTVEGTDMQWDEERVGECELEADYSVDPQRWKQLLKRLGIDDKIAD